MIHQCFIEFIGKGTGLSTRINYKTSLIQNVAGPLLYLYNVHILHISRDYFLQITAFNPLSFVLGGIELTTF